MPATRPTRTSIRCWPSSSRTRRRRISPTPSRAPIARSASSGSRVSQPTSDFSRACCAIPISPRTGSTPASSRNMSPSSSPPRIPVIASSFSPTRPPQPSRRAAPSTSARRAAGNWPAPKSIRSIRSRCSSHGKSAHDSTPATSVVRPRTTPRRITKSPARKTRSRSPRRCRERSSRSTCARANWCAPGQQLFVMEAMKMEHVIRAHTSGDGAADRGRRARHDLRGPSARLHRRGRGRNRRRRPRPTRSTSTASGPISPRCIERHADGLDAARPEAVARRRKTASAHRARERRGPLRSGHLRRVRRAGARGAAPAPRARRPDRKARRPTDWSPASAGSTATCSTTRARSAS